MSLNTPDMTLPHSTMRLRAQGSLCIVQPYVGAVPSGEALMLDLSSGHAKLEKSYPLKEDYIVVYALLGILPLKSGQALAVVTSAAKVATVAKCSIYAVTSTRVITKDGAAPADKDDARLVSLLKAGVDPHGVGRGLYFSTECNVTLSQQRQAAARPHSALWECSTPEYFWNATLSLPLQRIAAHKFIAPFILGFVCQIENAHVAAASKAETLTVTLIARRSNRRAGTRHWRRGVDLQGNVANFVESEQIVQSASGHRSAFVQLRGSIPICWSQVPNTKYKPSTVIADCEHVSAAPFQLHSRRNVEAYGRVVGINLANQHGTEGRLGADYRTLTARFEKEMDIALVVFDFHKECGATNYQNLDKLWDTLARDFATFGMFEAAPDGSVRRRQTGALRTNCIDCLDRTNVVQGMLARKALESVLRSLALMPRNSASLAAFPLLEQQFKLMWADHGDMISRQYAGTGALKSGFTRTGKRTLGGLIDDGLKSVVRYYLNNYEDGLKQDALDLITGNFDVSVVSKASPFKKQASGAIPVLLSAVLLLVSVQCAVTLPFSRRVSFLYHVLLPFVASAALFGCVIALGRRATCRPMLCPAATQPWLKAA